MLFPLVRTYVPPFLPSLYQSSTEDSLYHHFLGYKLFYLFLSEQDLSLLRPYSIYNLKLSGHSYLPVILDILEAP